MSQPKRWSHGLTGMSRNRSGPWVTWDDYAALAADRTKWINLSVEHEKEVAELQGKIAALASENERLKAKLSMSEAIAEICSQPPGEGAVTVKASLSTGKTVLPDIILNHPRTEGGPK